MRILHLSDLHFGNHHWQVGRARGPGYGPAALSTTIPACLAVHRIGPVDGVVVSGDVTEHATPEDFATALRELRALVRVLDIDKKNVVMTPGNHDIDWSKAEEDRRNSTDHRFDQWRKFIDKFYSSVGRSAVYPSGAPPFVGIHTIGEALFASISSCLFANDQNLYGYVGSKQLAWLTSHLQAKSAPLKVVVVHHHPLPDPRDVISPDPSDNARVGIDLSMIRDGGMMLSMLAAAGVDLVLHGHKHAPMGRFHRFVGMNGVNDGGIYILGAGSAGVAEADLPRFQSHHGQLIEIDEWGRGRVMPMLGDGLGWQLNGVSFGISLPRARYDELANLTSELDRTKYRGVSIVEHLRTAVQRRGCNNWTPRKLMQAAFGPLVQSDGQQEEAYSRLILHGFFRFLGTNEWWDKNEFWTSTLQRVEIAPRGVALIAEWTPL